MECIYTDDTPDQNRQKQHKEELKHRRALDAHDRGLVVAEMEKYPHPLAISSSSSVQSSHWPNPPDLVNVAESIAIGEQMESKYRASLLEGSLTQLVAPSRQSLFLKEHQGQQSQVSDRSTEHISTTHDDWSASEDGARASIWL